MKTAVLSFLAASVILGALLSGCFNPAGFTLDAPPEEAAGTDADAGGKAAGIQDTGGFTVTIPVNPEPDWSAGRAAAGLGGNAIQYGGARNTFLLAVLDTATGKVAYSDEKYRKNDDDKSATMAVTLAPGANYRFLLLMGHRERDYGQETADGDYVYKDGAPTLLAAGVADAAIKPDNTTVAITMSPVTVEANFISATAGTVGAKAGGVSLGAAEDWKLTWTIANLAALKEARAAGTGSVSALWRSVSGAAWRTSGGSAFASGAAFDYGTDTTTLYLGGAPVGVECAAAFNLEYAPFSLASGQWNGQPWVIRNGINDEAQDGETDFSVDNSSGKVKWRAAAEENAAVNGNGAVRFTAAAAFSGVTANGEAYKTPTTELTLTFDRPGIGGLTAADISLADTDTDNGTSTEVSGGTLTRLSDTWYRLAVTGIKKEETIRVTITERDGVKVSPASQEVTVHCGSSALVVSATDFSNEATKGGSAIDLIGKAKNDAYPSVYIQLLYGTETVDFGTADTDIDKRLVLSTTAGEGVESPPLVVIDGGGRTVDLQGSPTGNALITVGSGVTLALRNITLKGLDYTNDPAGDETNKIDKADNNAAVIKVTSGGHLILEEGTKITGNYSTNDGGGVYVDVNGTLTMRGGTVSGNTTEGSGGGVSTNGTFTMSGGTISGNNTPTSGDKNGGGVYVSGGTFEMSGGTISDNTASFGGGVHINNPSGMFIMQGGTISGNKATNYGGGVRPYLGMFKMTGGTISGNTAASSCGGVCMNPDGSTFTKTGGGTIYGVNEGANTNKGGAVFYSSTQKRSSTAWPEDDLDSNKTGEEGGWEE